MGQDSSHIPKIGEGGWGAPVLAALAVGAYCTAFRRYGLELADEGTLLAQVDRVLHGEIPYRDFHTGYGPGLFLLNAALAAAFGPSTTVVRGGLAVVQAIRAGALAWLVARVAPGWTGIALAVFVGFFLPVAPGVVCPFLVPYAS